MKTSKFVGKTFDNGWTCTNIFLAGNYSSGTKHNAYRYELERLTSDKKFIKSITVSGATLNKINKGETTVEAVAKNKKNSTKRIDVVLYRFN